MLTPAVERTSALPNTSADEAWAAATDPAGINDELKPVLRMTMPRRLRGRDISQFPVGTPAGRSWILLGGVIPVDYDDLCLVELEAEGPRRRFLERSQMAALRVWQHERVVEPLGDGGSRVSDRLGFELRGPLTRVPGVARLATAIIGALFSHRHRRLRKRDSVAAP